MFSRPILHQRVGFWSLSLSEFDIRHEPQKAVKNQALADFLADHPCLSTTREIELDLDECSLKPWTMYFDGSSTAEKAGIRVVLVSPLGEPFQFLAKLNEYCTNNQAEYEALILGLETLLDMGVTHVSIKGDSQLVIQQVMGTYKCQSSSVVALLDIAKKTNRTV